MRFASFTLLAGLVVILATVYAGATQEQDFFSNYKPWAFPLFLGIGLFCSGLFERITNSNSTEGRTNNHPDLWATIEVLSLIMLFATTVEIVGFMTSASVCMLLLAVSCGGRIVSALLLAVLVPLTVERLLTFGLGISLPTGIY